MEGTNYTTEELGDFTILGRESEFARFRLRSLWASAWRDYRRQGHAWTRNDSRPGGPDACTLRACSFRSRRRSERDPEPELKHARLIRDIAVERRLPVAAIAFLGH